MNKQIKNITAQNFGKVAVLCGGDSSERKISLSSGKSIFTALLQRGIDAHLVDTANDVVSQLRELCPDRAFIALHGKGGEDGEIQGLLECMHIPYTGSAVKASALAMDKYLAKIIFKEFGLPVLPSVVLTDNFASEHVDKFIEQHGLPLCVKPTSNGSTIGVSKVLAYEELLPAYRLARQYDVLVMIEPWVNGREFTVAILGDEALPTIEIIPNVAFYDYDAKYNSDATQFICPCDLTAAEEKQLHEISVRAFRALGCRHFARVDFLRDEQGNFWLLEINTIPGLTDHSLLPKAAKAVGMDYAELAWRILEHTL